jgi:hypothetical protein
MDKDEIMDKIVDYAAEPTAVIINEKLSKNNIPISESAKTQAKASIAKKQTSNPQPKVQEPSVSLSAASIMDMDKLIDSYCMEKYSVGAAIYSIFHIIMTVVAIFLSIRCNSKMLDLGAILVAIFFPYIYIIWVFATKDLKAQCNL